MKTKSCAPRVRARCECVCARARARHGERRGCARRAVRARRDGARALARAHVAVLDGEVEPACALPDGVDCVVARRPGRAQAALPRARAQAHPAARGQGSVQASARDKARRVLRARPPQSAARATRARQRSERKERGVPDVRGRREAELVRRHAAQPVEEDDRSEAVLGARGLLLVARNVLGGGQAEERRSDRRRQHGGLLRRRARAHECCRGLARKRELSRSSSPHLCWRSIFTFQDWSFRLEGTVTTSAFNQRLVLTSTPRP